MGVIAAVLRGSFVREGLVVTDIVVVNPVAGGRVNSDRSAQVAKKRGHGDVHHIVAETPAIGPAAGDKSAVTERILDIAL